ncbi:MAG: HAD family hydrolase [Elusimicrobia bacterium]|nr:HAD family hydrolase [Elusimicrobiota bacterium]MDE2424962.1 HAD family hydrolase [Elusimicrobiota bacterium]
MSAAVAASQREVLTALLRELAQKAGRGEAPLAIFDLDDTLLSTAARNLRILREFAAQAGGRWEEAERLRGLSAERLRYSILDSAREAGLERPELLAELRRFWRERFFTNDYLASDEPVPGAAEFCADLLAAGARLAFLSGRDESMRPGTESSLRRHGLGAEGAALILKPSFDTPDMEFKSQALARLPALGAVAAAFENEPAHVNLFAQTFPKARVFLLETKHSGKPILPHARVRAIKDFRRC